MSFYRIARHALLIALVLAPAGAGRASAVEALSCAGLPVISAGGSYRGGGFVPGRSDRLAVEVAEPGVLVLSVAAPGRRALAPELDLGAFACDAGDAGRPARVVRTSTALLALVAEPGLYPLRVVPRDPLLALGPYRVESRFAPPVRALPESGPRSLHGADGTGGQGPGEEEEEEIEEVDGEPMNLGVPEPGVVVLGGATGSPSRLVAVSAGPIAPEPSVAGRAPWLGFAAVCRSRGDSDDHADLPLCATAIDPGGPVSGAIANRLGDDHDHFSFVLAAPARVTLETAGETDVLGGLYDASGRRLALDDDGGAGGNFRLEADLEPGRYHVRVEGADGAEGEYRLSLAVAGR